MASRTRPRIAPTNEENYLKHACDAGILSDTCPYDGPDDHNNIDSEDSHHPSGSSDYSTPKLRNLAACFRVFSDSLARMEIAEMEMVRARETSRWEAEKRRMELDAELTRMMLGTQLQIATLVAGKRHSKKRKRTEVEEEDESMGDGKGALLLSLSQNNFSF